MTINRSFQMGPDDLPPPIFAHYYEEKTLVHGALMSWDGNTIHVVPVYEAPEDWVKMGATWTRVEEKVN